MNRLRFGLAALADRMRARRRQVLEAPFAGFLPEHREFDRLELAALAGLVLVRVSDRLGSLQCEVTVPEASHLIERLQACVAEASSRAPDAHETAWLDWHYGVCAAPERNSP